MTLPPRRNEAAQRAAAELRQGAEERLDALAAAAAASPSLPVPEELTAAVHELRVHQIELEMQNEELRRVELELDAQRAKYFALFDLAPVGYLTLDEKGIVDEANLTATHLLGVERRLLVGRPFTAFVCAPDQDAYYLYFRMLQKAHGPQTCELRLQRVDAEPFWAHLDGQPQDIADGEPQRYHLTFTDVPERALAEEALRRRVADLTPREREVLALLAAGMSNGKIAERLVLSIGTVRLHVGSILAKLGVPNRTSAAIVAVKHGLD